MADVHGESDYLQQTYTLVGKDEHGNVVRLPVEMWRLSELMEHMQTVIDSNDEKLMLAGRQQQLGLCHDC